MTATAFKDGAGVVYPGHGFGTVVTTKDERIGDTPTRVLVIGFANGLTVRIPVGKIQRCGLRAVSSRATMRDALTVLREPAARKKSMWRLRALEYTAKIKTGEPRAIAEILRDLHRGPGSGEATYSEKAIYQQARDLLVPELAAVDRTDIETAGKKIDALLQAA
ncbi:MAG: CarD family transcriptional regulator [Rhodospirillaceae bacterium]